MLFSWRFKSESSELLTSVWRRVMERRVESEQEWWLNIAVWRTSAPDKCSCRAIWTQSIRLDQLFPGGSASKPRADQGGGTRVGGGGCRVAKGGTRVVSTLHTWHYTHIPGCLIPTRPPPPPPPGVRILSLLFLSYPVTFSLLDTYHLSCVSSRGGDTALWLGDSSDTVLLLVEVRGTVPGLDYILFRVWFGK